LSRRARLSSTRRWLLPVGVIGGVVDIVSTRHEPAWLIFYKRQAYDGIYSRLTQDYHQDLVTPIIDANRFNSASDLGFSFKSD
jgi:hypothetical protein